MADTNPIFCALDTDRLDHALDLADRLGATIGGLKIGLELVHAAGPDAVRRISASGLPVFLDVKLHDIPNTVAGALRSLVPLGPAFITIHASGGPDMLAAAAETTREVAERNGVPRPRLLGVTVLTSLDEGDLVSIGWAPDVGGAVERLARLAIDNGLDGCICAPGDIRRLRAALGCGPILMVPGIRPAGSAHGDQKRAMTPAEAMAAGADHLVIGRPITGAGDPAAAARSILAGLAEGRADSRIEESST